MKYSCIIVGTGVAGLYSALNLPDDDNILIITKKEKRLSDSFLAQGGICYLKSDDDYDSFFEDTMKAGHYENNKESVDIMIRESRIVVKDLESYGTRFTKENGEFVYTKEGGHSTNRILFHKDITGDEITSHLLSEVEERDNITILENTTLTDIIVENGSCKGIVATIASGEKKEFYALDVILATGGIGGLYEHSTNYPHLTGDALEIAKKHGIELEHLDYVQIHPTTFYLPEDVQRERSFLVSESVRGEGAHLLNANMERFVDELIPRDLLTAAINDQMKKEGSKHVWLDMTILGEKTIRSHFPNIFSYCVEHGYDPTEVPIPVVPAQHYFMGGIKVDSNSKTTMEHLYAAGETSCNGVHGKNRLASNSLLESLVFARRAALHIVESRVE